MIALIVTTTIVKTRLNCHSDSICGLFLWFFKLLWGVHFLNKLHVGGKFLPCTNLRGQNLDQHLSPEYRSAISAECWSTYRPIFDRHASVTSRPTRMLADARSISHQHSADTLPTRSPYSAITCSALVTVSYFLYSNIYKISCIQITFTWVAHSQHF